MLASGTGPVLRGEQLILDGIICRSRLVVQSIRSGVGMRGGGYSCLSK